MAQKEDPLRELSRFLAAEVGIDEVPRPRERSGSAAETHFELGVAYAQMGLLDQALAELNRAAEEPDLRAPSAAVLGSVHLERGEPDRAIAWYRCGLATRGLPRRTRLGLLHELGCAHLAAGDPWRATRAFALAARIDPNYRHLPGRR